MPIPEKIRVYLLTSLPSETVTRLVDGFVSAGFEIVYDQNLVLRAVEDLIPGDTGDDAYVSVSADNEDRPNEELKAEGRLQGLKSVDSNLILFRASLVDKPVVSAISDSIVSIPERAISLIFPLAITYISKKLGQRSARKAEKREALEQVDRSLAEHIAPILTSLDKRERNLRYAAIASYAVALLTLVGGLWAALVRVHQLHDKPLTSWFDVVAASVGGLIVIGMLTAVARLAFILGRAFMVESLTNGDRAHAISFGRFYLQVFKDRAEWSEIKEAFEDWNTGRGSSFIAQKVGDIDPMVFQVATELAKTIASKSNIK